MNISSGQDWTSPDRGSFILFSASERSNCVPRQLINYKKLLIELSGFLSAFAYEIPVLCNSNWGRISVQTRKTISKAGCSRAVSNNQCSSLFRRPQGKTIMNPGHSKKLYQPVWAACIIFTRFSIGQFLPPA